MTARRYRIRVYYDGSEVLTDREYEAVLDLVSSFGLAQAEAKLDELALTLARADGARDTRVARYYLAVHDRATGELELHWPAKAIGH